MACATCGQGAEKIGFIDPQKRSTKAFRRYVGGLCKVLPNGQVAARMQISEDTVRTMDKEFIAANYPPPDFSTLHALGIDEIAYRKGQKYITLVCNYETGEIVWTGEGRSAKTLKAFFTGRSGRLQTDRRRLDGHGGAVHQGGACRVQRGAHRLRPLPRHEAPERGCQRHAEDRDGDSALQ